MKNVPAALKRDDYAALSDPDLLSMGAEIALLTTRTSQLLDRLSTSEAPSWDAAVALAKKLATILSEYELPEAEQAAKLLVEVVNEGQTKTAANEATWIELRQLIQERAKVAAVEHRHKVDLETLIPADKASHAFVRHDRRRPRDCHRPRSVPQAERPVARDGAGGVDEHKLVNDVRRISESGP